MKTFAAAFACVCLLAACASSTRYTPAADDDSYGYSESRLADNRFRIDFRGNGATTSSEVKDMALLRAAELTLLNGYDWFRVVSQETEQDTLATPQTEVVGETRQVYRDCGLLACTTTVTPPAGGVEVLTLRDVDRYSTSIEIVMGRGDLADVTTSYNAAELRNNLAGRY